MGLQCVFLEHQIKINFLVFTIDYLSHKVQYQLGDLFIVFKIYNKVPMVARHHGIQMKRFHDGPMVIFPLQPFLFLDQARHHLPLSHKKMFCFHAHWPCLHNAMSPKPLSISLTTYLSIQTNSKFNLLFVTNMSHPCHNISQV